MNRHPPTAIITPENTCIPKKSSSGMFATAAAIGEPTNTEIPTGNHPIPRRVPIKSMLGDSHGTTAAGSVTIMALVKPYSAQKTMKPGRLWIPIHAKIRKDPTNAEAMRIMSGPTLSATKDGMMRPKKDAALTTAIR